MKKRELEELLEEILKGRDIFKVFLGLKWPPSQVLQGIVSLQHPDAEGVISTVSKRHKVGKDYLLQQVDRILRQLGELKNNNPYSILGIPPDAPQSEIREAWKRQMRRWHPDRNQDRIEEAQRRTRRYNEAYEILKDPQDRMRYDRTHLSLILLLQGLGTSELFSRGTSEQKGEKPPKPRKNDKRRFRLFKFAVVAVCLISIAAWAGHRGVDMLLKYDMGRTRSSVEEDELSVAPPHPVPSPVTVNQAALPQDVKQLLNPKAPDKEQEQKKRMVQKPKAGPAAEIQFKPLLNVAMVDHLSQRKRVGEVAPDPKTNSQPTQSQSLKEKKKGEPSQKGGKEAVSSKKAGEGKGGFRAKGAKAHKKSSKKSRHKQVSSKKKRKGKKTPKSEEKVDESLLAIVMRELKSLVKPPNTNKVASQNTVAKGNKRQVKSQGKPTARKPANGSAHEKKTVFASSGVKAKEKPFAANRLERTGSKSRPTRQTQVKNKKSREEAENMAPHPAKTEPPATMDHHPQHQVAKGENPPTPQSQDRRKSRDTGKKPMAEMSTKENGEVLTPNSLNAKPIRVGLTRPDTNMHMDKTRDSMLANTRKERPALQSSQPESPKPKTEQVEVKRIKYKRESAEKGFTTPDHPVQLASATSPEEKPTKASKGMTLAEEQRKLGTAFAWDLVERFADSYRRGDLNELVSLFSPDAVDNGERFKKLIPRYRYQFDTFEVRYYKVLKPQITPLGDNQYLVKGHYQMELGVKGGQGGQRFSGPISWKICSTTMGLRICEVTSSMK